MVTFDEEKQNKRVEEMRKIEEEDVSKILAKRYGLEYLDLQSMPINSDALRVISEENARLGNIAAFDIVAKKIKIAVLSPKNEKTEAVIKLVEKDGYFPTLYMVSKASLEKAWSRYKDISFASESKAGSFDISNDHVVELTEKIKVVQDVIDMTAELNGIKQAYRISKIMEIMLAGSLALGASDIHIEPEETEVRMRFRLDGVLINIINFDLATYSLILSRIKLLSGLKLNVKSEAQDGRFAVKIKDSEIQIRTSVLPGAYSESIVMRLLNPKSISVPLESLGIEPRTLSILLEQIQKPNGMLLITGPTGSGKTTTLYAFMRKINSQDIKIITIEDPIEYHLAGVVQTQVEDEKGYTFLAGLRAALRQDPDVIMVGEIRDSETAGTAINAALTGHLVFSTLHTNSAVGAFPRLIDLGINPQVITSAVNVVMAQRLIRKLCPNCKAERPANESEKKIIEQTITSIDDKTYLEGVQLENVYEAKGCEKCNNTGYKGRVAVCEAALATKEVGEIITMNPSEESIKQASRSQNILDMKQDGVLKILRGISTFDELGRVIDLEIKI